MNISIPNPHTQSLLEEISAFIEAHGVSESRFGEMVLNDPNFVSDLRSGREPRWGTVVKVRKGMANFKSEDAA